MPARRTSSAVALVVGASGLLMMCVFGFLSFVPGIDPAVEEMFELAFFMGALVALASFVAYVVMSRQGGAGAPTGRFDRMLDKRKAAMGAIPIGIVAVAIGALWFVLRTMGEQGFVAIEGAEKFNDFQTPGIIAFLGFGTLYVAVATWLVIRAERGAIRAIRDREEAST